MNDHGKGRTNRYGKMLSNQSFNCKKDVLRNIDVRVATDEEQTIVKPKNETRGVLIGVIS